MSLPPQRLLQKSNAQFARAVQRLPFGLESTFRYWGADPTICETCLPDTLRAVGAAVDLTLEYPEAAE